MSVAQIVLVVDDSVEQRTALGQWLEEDGYEAWMAQDGSDALRLLECAREKPSLILLDIQMPVMDGVRFRKAQLQDAGLALIPVVLISSCDDLVQRARELRVAGYMRKP